jgi:hypothetical protein
MRDTIPTDHDELERWTFQKIGEFIVWFSRLEYGLRCVLADAISLPDKLFDAVTASYDFHKLCEVTRVACEAKFTAAQMVKMNKLLGRCLQINDYRVRIAHGTWSSFGATHMSRGKGLKVTQYFSNPAELARSVRDCLNLSTDVVVFCAKLAADNTKAQAGTPPAH